MDEILMLIILEGTDSMANVVDATGKVTGKSTTYHHVETVNVTGILATLKNTSTFFHETQKTLVDDFIVSDCVFELDGSDCLIDMAGYPANLQISNTTLWSEKGHTGHILHANGRVKNLDPTQSTLKQNMTLDHCTLYRIAQGSDINHLAGQSSRSLVMTLTNSIIYDCGTDGEEVKGWLGGAATDGPTVTYGHNTYWSNGKFQKGWVDEEIDGTDLTNTAYQVDPGFFDVVGGDFAIATISPQAVDSETDIQNGDPRWATWASGDYYVRVSYNAEQGDVLVNKSYANAETEITISALPAVGYEVASVIVTDEQGNEIPLNNTSALRLAGGYGEVDPAEIEDNVDVKSFIMPNNSVSIAVTFKQETTAVKTVKSATKFQDGAWYDLQGRKFLTKPTTPGIYLMNGNKILIK
jgi:hypothetical protein